MAASTAATPKNFSAAGRRNLAPSPEEKKLVKPDTQETQEKAKGKRRIFLTRAFWEKRSGGGKATDEKGSQDPFQAKGRSAGGKVGSGGRANCIRGRKEVGVRENLTSLYLPRLDEGHRD